MVGKPTAMHFLGSTEMYGPKREFGQSYTNPYGNITVVDNAFEDMLPYVHSHWYSFPPMNTMWYGIITLFLGVCTILALLGNLSVIYIFSCTKTLRTPPNYYIVTLAFSDFCQMAVMAPPVFINSYFKTWAMGPLFCQIYGAVGSFTGCTSIYIMCLISRDRYNVIVKGLGGTPLTPCRAMLQILLVWLLSCAWTVAPFFGWGRYAPEGNMTACGTDYLNEDWLTKSYVMVYACWVWLFPLLFLIYSYWYIVAAVASHEKQMRLQAQKMGVKSLRIDKDAQKKSAECKLAKVALVTVTLWFMAWTPYLVINFTGIFKREILTPLFSIWGSVFAKANTVYNPIVYAISHPKYKEALNEKMPCITCRRESENEESKSASSTVTTTNDDDKE